MGRAWRHVTHGNGPNFRVSDGADAIPADAFVDDTTAGASVVIIINGGFAKNGASVISSDEMPIGIVITEMAYRDESKAIECETEVKPDADIPAPIGPAMNGIEKGSRRQGGPAAVTG